MHIRCHSWGKANISWSTVQEQLLNAAQNLGHDPIFVSTNGYDGMEFWSPERVGQVAQRHKTEVTNGYDIDITYAFPRQFEHRFLKDSKVKIGRYDYESSPFPASLVKCFDVPDYVVGSSDFVCNLFIEAGADPAKVRKIPNGIDPKIFNPYGSKLSLEKLGVKKDAFIFLAVAEPHYRKQLDKLLDVYCKSFTAKDNTCLIIKTKIADPLIRMEQNILPHLARLKEKYKDNMPQVKLVTNRLKSLGSLYRAAHVFCLPTVGEGWGMPFLEAMACNNIVIAPNYGGQLDFLTDENSLLCPVKKELAMPEEQYFTVVHDKLDVNNFNSTTKGIVGRPDLQAFGELMKYAYSDHSKILAAKKDAMAQTAAKYTWEYAAKCMLELANDSSI